MSDLTDHPNDAEFLDALLDRALELVEDGLTIDTDTLLADREHLRPQVEELVRLAQLVCVSRPVAPIHVPGYTVLSELGHGGMGVVYLAKQDRLGGRLVALKILPSAATLSARSRERFLAEANAIARFHHPNVVTIPDVIHQGHLCAYAMEWIEGHSLAEVIELVKARRHPGAPGLPQRGSVPSSPPFVAPWLRGSVAYPVFISRLGIAIARALQAVHEAGLLHRDVKPSNILLRRDGTPLLSDFGLVRETDTTIHTQTGHFVGTVTYAAPEQLRGEQDKLDPRTDVYSLGVTLYHALTLRLPYSPNPSRELFARPRNRIAQSEPETQATGSPPSCLRASVPSCLSPLALLKRIESGRITPLRKINPKLPRDLETIVTKAIDPDPARRYQTAAELADDLERLLNLQPIKAKPAGLVTRAWKAARRNRASLFGAVIGGVIALALAAAAGVYFLALPRWVKQHVDQARLTLLHPEQGNQIFSEIFWNQPPTEATAIHHETLEAALGHYDTALRWRPFDEDVRREREVVELAIKKGTEAQGTEASRRAGMPSCLPAELRTAGLYSLLTGDAPGALGAWTRLDPLAPSDPFVEAALGMLHLANGEPARAYPRLQNAVIAFPNVSFLTQYLADAAVQCGDLARALGWIERGRRQPMQDKFSGLDRVTVDLYAAQGRDEEAIALYKSLARNNPVAEFNHARLLESRGRFKEAAQLYARVLGRVPNGRRPQEAFIRTMEKWWEGLGDVERFATLRKSLDDAGSGSESILVLLRLYVARLGIPSADPDPERPPGRDRPGSSRADQEPGKTKRIGFFPFVPRVPARRDDFVAFFTEFATPPASDSSSPLQRDTVSLTTLAQRMEVNDMNRWNCFRKLPSQMKDALAEAWLTPAYGLKEHLITGVAKLGGMLDAAREQARRHPGAPESLRRSSRTPSSPHRSPSCLRAFVPTCLVVAAATTHGQCPPIGFQGLGDLPGGAVDSGGYAVSLDGTTVVGESAATNGYEAFRWRADTGIVGLGDLPGADYKGIAYGVSADGNVVAGWSSSSANGGPEAFRWTQATGLTGLGSAPGSPGISGGDDLSDDGTVVFVSSGAGSAIWTTTGGWTVIEPTNSACYGGSRNGEWATGPHFGSGQAWRWSQGSGFQLIGDLPGGATSASGNDISDNGAVVGRSSSASGTEAFVLTQANGIVGLGDLPGGAFNSNAVGISTDGSLIVGWGTSSVGEEAVLWDSNFTLYRVADILAATGVEVPCGWLLQRAYHQTTNCGVITLVGRGLNPDGDPEAWIASYIPGSQPPYWAERCANGPSPRQAVMVYDSNREVSVLFGGWDVNGPLGDTWEWDGNSWTQRMVSGPTPRFNNHMAYDSARGVTVVFGGSVSGGLLGDTWEWNGTSWSLRSTSGPDIRESQAMAFDSARGVTVLFSGLVNFSYDVSDTWEWNGSSWTVRATTGPQARIASMMAFDSGRGVSVLFGGAHPPSGNTVFGDTWEWDGTTWTLRATTGPSPRVSGRLVYDSQRGRTILFGGRVYPGVTPFDDMWEWDGTSWTQIIEFAPPARSYHGMSYDSARDRVVVFSGYTGSYFSDTWEFGSLAGDPDGDLIDNCADNCPNDANECQEDADADGVGNVCDNCNLANPDQADCDTNSIGDVCDIAAGACDENSNLILDVCECWDDDVCTVKRFDMGGACETLGVAFGDVDASGVAEIGDVLCVLDGYGNFCDCPNGDIAPCNPDGIIELTDVLAMLDAYNGLDPCGCTP